MSTPTPSDRRTLVVVRHARAAESSNGDHDRPLTPSGIAAAREAGHWLRSQGLVADQALVSSALRTRETWAAIRVGAGWQVEEQVDAALYSAGVESALDLLHELDGSTACAVLVGHNPTVAMLAALLPDGTGDPAAEKAITTGGFPPASVAVFTFEGSWWDLREGAATLVAHHVGADGA